MSVDPRTERLDQIRARVEAATPGPWTWRIFPRHHSVELTTQDPERGRLIVMDFVRWGTQGAIPRFIREKFFMEKFTEVRDHPDAALIENSVSDLSWLLTQLDARDEAIAKLRELHTIEKRWQSSLDAVESFDSAKDAARYYDMAEEEMTFFEVCAECARIEMDPDQNDDYKAYKESLWPCPTAAVLGLLEEQNQ